MAGQRQPIELLLAKDKKHLTKAEIEKRKKSEVKPCADNIVAPSYLSAHQKKEFEKIAGQLDKLNIIGETDCDALARYIIAMSQYKDALKDAKNIKRLKPKNTDDLYDYTEWFELIDKVDKRIDKYFKQAQTAANALGLTISSRCRLVVPQTDETPKDNKFAKFEKRDA